MRDRPSELRSPRAGRTRRCLVTIAAAAFLLLPALTPVTALAQTTGTGSTSPATPAATTPATTPGMATPTTNQGSNEGTSGGGATTNPAPSANGTTNLTAPSTLTTVNKVTHDMDVFDDQPVMLSGDLVHVLSDRAFVIADDDILFPDTMLVVTAQPFRTRNGQPIDLTAFDGQTLFLTGTAHRFDEQLFEQQTKLTLDQPDFEAWISQPAMIADSVSFSPPPVMAAALANVANQGVTVAQIAANPAAMYGQTVNVTGRVDQVVAPKAFTLADDNLLEEQQILVVADLPLLNQTGEASKGLWLNQELHVVGKVQQFDVDQINTTYNLTLDPNTFATWEGKPVMVAMSIHHADESVR
ncbi:MAG: hypothetical protein IT305_01845 [Chloroflexi bacterium]|nr:hypothetical protein [Chloroflexota bacterium]